MTDKVKCAHNYKNKYCDYREVNIEVWEDCKGCILYKKDERVFDTGAIRNSSSGKGRCDLLPPSAILRLARHFEKGCERYGDRNWERGIPIDSFIDSGLRHLLQYMRGDKDEDHLCAAAWNLICAMEMEEVKGYKFKEGGD